MNKFLCLILIFCLLLCLPNTVMAAETDYQIRNTLNSIGILSDYGETNFNEETIITKAQMCNIVLQALQFKECVDDGRFTTYFTDVPNDYWALGEINTCYQLGIAKGSGSNFNPEQDISFNECVTMWLRAMNYETLAEANGGYPTGYLITAQNLKLLKDVQATDKVTGATVARIIYNSLNVSFFDPMKENNDETLLSRRNIIKSKGRIIKNNVSALVMGESPENDGFVNIDGKRYDVGETNIGNYIGYTVGFYYEYFDDDVPVIKSFFVYNEEKTKNIFVEDIIKFSDRSITYYLDDSIVTEELAQAPIYLYNGAVVNPKTVVPTLKSGVVTLITGGNNNDYDMVIINEYEHYLVNYASDSTESIYLSSGEHKGKKVIELKDIDYHIYKNGKEIKLDEINQNDIISVCQSVDEKNMTIEVLDKKFSGSICEFDDKSVKISDTWYDISIEYSSRNNIDMMVGKTGDFYLDRFEKIFYADYSTDSERNYGFVFAMAGDSTSNLDQDKEMKIFTNAGKCEIFVLNDKVNVVNYITPDGKYTTKQLKADEAYKYIKTVINADYTLITYKLNDNGKINTVELPREGTVDGSSDTTHTLNLKLTESRYMAYGRMVNAAHFSDLTKVFIISQNDDGDYDEKNSRIKGSAYFEPGYHGSEENPIWFYNIGLTGIADAVLFIEKDSSEYAEVDGMIPYIFVEKMKTLDKDGMTCDSLILNSEGNKSTVVVSDKCKKSDADCPDINDLKFGDVLIYDTNEQGEMIRYNVIQKIDNFKMGPIYLSGGGYYPGFATNFSIFAGEAYANDTTAIRIVADNDYYTCTHNSTKYTKVNLKYKTITGALATDCVCTEGQNIKGSKVILKADRNRVTSIIIFEED